MLKDWIRPIEKVNQMKSFLIITSMLLSLFSFSQNKEFNTKNKFIAKGYDVVAYFEGTATEGKKQFTVTHQGGLYKFKSQKNLETFLKQPSKYIPQYGGWCAYAIAKDGSKVNIDPETYEIQDGKLYLFYNAWGINTKEKWLEEGAKKLQKEADIRWGAH